MPLNSRFEMFDKYYEPAVAGTIAYEKWIGAVMIGALELTRKAVTNR